MKYNDPEDHDITNLYGFPDNPMTAKTWIYKTLGDVGIMLLAVSLFMYVLFLFLDMLLGA